MRRKETFSLAPSAPDSKHSMVPSATLWTTSQELIPKGRCCRGWDEKRRRSGCAVLRPGFYFQLYNPVAPSPPDRPLPRLQHQAQQQALDSPPTRPLLVPRLCPLSPNLYLGPVSCPLCTYFCPKAATGPNPLGLRAGSHQDSSLQLPTAPQTSLCTSDTAKDLAHCPSLVPTTEWSSPQNKTNTLQGR